tara:strand:- start:1339 stop:1728 length:390 start_codon:yes stop_codon:yes gene_type:complete
MAVQRITHKKIKKYDTDSPNFNPDFKQPEKKEVSGNIKEDTDLYGEKKHYYTPDSNGNLKMEELMGKMLNKLDNIPGGSQTGTNAIEVDIKREIAIGKVDASAVESEEFVGKVKTKKDKLKALRRRNGR